MLRFAIAFALVSAFGLCVSLLFLCGLPWIAKVRRGLALVEEQDRMSAIMRKLGQEVAREEARQGFHACECPACEGTGQLRIVEHIDS